MPPSEYKSSGVKIFKTRSDDRIPVVVVVVVVVVAAVRFYRATCLYNTDY